jgi:hypothetical protein
MKNRHALVGGLALALAASVGCGGDGDKSISGVIPGEVFVGRSADVLIVGNNTEWGEGVAVNFGAGITVGAITVASPTALMVNITADASTELGTRDVVVTHDGDSLSFEGAFQLTSPVRLAIQGTLAQGSIAMVKVQNLDFANPFDTTTTGDGFFTPLEYVNIVAATPNGVEALIQSVDAYSIEMLVLTDVDATAGAQDLEILSGPVGFEQSFRYPGGFAVEAREAIALSPNAPYTGSVGGPFESQLYSISLTDIAIVTAATFSDEPNTSSAFALLPASGSFAQMVNYTSQITLVTDDTYYLVYWDGSGASGYSYQIGARVEAVAHTLAEAEPNDTIPEAQESEDLPFVLSGATIADIDDEDWVRITAVEADVGKRINVITYGGPYTDTKVSVHLGNGDLLGTVSSDFDWHENHSSAAIPAAGDYFVKIFASDAGYYDPAYSNYGAAIRLVD